jgi:branched-subunit amino acid ABC-type transport system permease component
MAPDRLLYCAPIRNEAPPRLTADLRTIGWRLLAAVCLLHLAISPLAAATQDIPAYTRIADDPGASNTFAKKFVALAIGETDHLVYGSSYDRGTMEEAKDDAMSRCKDQLPSGGCKIILSEEAACIALYWTPTGTGWGASTRTTREDAKTAALKSCDDKNGEGKCVFAGSWCSN